MAKKQSKSVKSKAAASIREKAGREWLASQTQLWHLQNQMQWLRGEIEFCASARYDIKTRAPLVTDREWWEIRSSNNFVRLNRAKKTFRLAAPQFRLLVHEGDRWCTRVGVLIDRLFSEWLQMIRPDPWRQGELAIVEELIREIKLCATVLRNAAESETLSAASHAPMFTGKFPVGEADQEFDPFRPASWYGQVLAPRLKKAARPARKTKRVRSRQCDGISLYSVDDAFRWWPDEVKKALTREKLEEDKNS